MKRCATYGRDRPGEKKNGSHTEGATIRCCVTCRNCCRSVPVPGEVDGKGRWMGRGGGGEGEVEWRGRWSGGGGRVEGEVEWRGGGVEGEVEWRGRWSGGEVEWRGR